MNNLYNKIYEAIDIGIHNALILPDELDNDISVRFRHKELSNDFIPYGQQVIDLGLSVKWAKYNYGAFPGSKPEDWYGNYYAWGETDDKSDYSWKTYEYCLNKKLTKYNTDSANGMADNKTALRPEDDVIACNLENMRMPTVNECKELLSNPYEAVSDYKGILGLNGILITGKNGNQLFLPFAGFIETSKLYYNGDTFMIWANEIVTDCNINIYADKCAYAIRAEMHENMHTDTYFRSLGCSVRGVQDK